MILIVDDKKENLLSLQSLLLLHGFAVHTSESGDDALKKVLQNNYALIILDVQMPGMDGFEVAELIAGSSKFRDLPIIFLSAANTEKRFITKGYSAGAVDYITKPVDPDIFLLKVNTLYKLYEQKRELTEMQARLRVEIEERKKAEQNSLQKAQELVSVLESIPQVAFTLTADGHVDYTNTHWKEYTCTADGFPETHPDDADLSGIMLSMIASEQPLELEIRMRKNETAAWRYFLLRTAPVRENGLITLWVGTFTDINEQKEVSRKKDEFISVASHELKTPLTSLKAYIQLLERVTAGNPSLSSYVQKALVQTDKLDKLIIDLLDVAQMESGRLRLNIENFDFEKMISNAVELMKQTYPDYQFICKANVHAIVRGDESRLEQVVLNFLSNAVKYSPNEKRIAIDILTRNTNEVEVRVQDFGIGIPEEEQAKVFEKFYRSMESTKNFKGLGLGLYISADILRRHDAKYGVESKPGKGTTFYFSLPIYSK